MNEQWERTAKSVELGWWKKELDRMGLEAFKESRRAYFAAMISGFKENFNPRGDIVNIGMGLMSIFNFINATGSVDAAGGVEVDPLADQYIKIIPDNSARIFVTATEDIEDGLADTVICFNTIDHTSEPEKMISEIHRILKEGGILYLEVNTDRYDSPAHYQKFGKELIQKLFKGKFRMVFENMKMGCGPLKNWDEYYAIMVKDGGGSHSNL